MTVRIALAQLAASPDKAENLARVLAAMDAAAARGAGLVVFPELALTRFFPQFEAFAGARALAEAVPGPASNAVAERARRHGLVTVLNLYEEADGRFYRQLARVRRRRHAQGCDPHGPHHRLRLLP